MRTLLGQAMKYGNFGFRCPKCCAENSFEFEASNSQSTSFALKCVGCRGAIAIKIGCLITTKLSARRFKISDVGSAGAHHGIRRDARRELVPRVPPARY